MALDAPAMAYGLTPAKMNAARQHVQTLSSRDREALLRALLEQYEQPQMATAPKGLPVATSLSSQSSAATSTASISAFTSSLFGCPPLREEAEEEAEEEADKESILSPPSPQQPTRASATPSTTPADSLTSSAPSLSSSTASSGRWMAPSPTPSSRLRSQSLSMSNPQPLRSSFSTSQLQKAPAHSRSRSLESTASMADVPQPLQLPGAKKALPKPILTIDTAVAASVVLLKTTRPQQGKEHLHLQHLQRLQRLQEPLQIQQQKQKQHTYWCTACGEKLYGRTTWAQHDAACRGNERRLACDGPTSGSHGHSGAGSGSRRESVRPQRAWGCGFCAAFLGSLERYQAHVAGHFERGRTLGHWHFANVIYGLLHQPAVHKPWKRLWAARVAALPAHLRPKATWSPGCCLFVREADDRETSLQEALEFFDTNLDSASTLALQADALAIYIAVPIDDDSQKPRQQPVPETKDQPTASVARPQLQENSPSPATSTTNLLPASTPISSPPATVLTGPTKNTALRSIPTFSTPLKPNNSTLSPSNLDVTKKDSKRASRLSPRKPSFLFKSKASTSSPETAAEKTAAISGEPATRQVIRKSPSSGTKLSKAHPPIYATMATGYASEQPPAPPPKPGAYGSTSPAGESTADWNSIATTIVDDIMAPVNALHITV
ncbi:hypothetical protein SCUCBS95973_009960 [Sporothrix curviconia]|uniref:C2H2-type domain-containing protein n=1 Tax=Sporothrix curviconia TaxID=1260050 RepID=A0ABP0D089_9PEZI